MAGKTIAFDQAAAGTFRDKSRVAASLPNSPPKLQPEITAHKKLFSISYVCQESLQIDATLLGKGLLITFAFARFARLFEFSLFHNG